MKIVCMGDSTMQYNDASTYPQIGWPQTLYPYLKKDVFLLDLAKNGRSTRTFLEEGRFEDALRLSEQGDVVLMQFGHNDEHVHNPERFTTPDQYYDNLVYMVNECRKKGAYVLLLTPIYRRWFKDGVMDMTCHQGYREKMIAAAKDTDTPVIDLTVLSREGLIEMGDEASKELFMNFAAGIYDNYPEGMNDDTHLRYKGGEFIRDLFLEAVKDNEKMKECLHV